MSHPWPLGHAPSLADTPESALASLSPRTSLLSSPDENGELPEAPRRVPRGPGQKFRHERERAHSSASHRDLMRLLVNEEYESRQTRKVLYTALDRLEEESRRAAAAESRLEDSVRQVRAINEARIAAQQQAAQAQEELRLYKLQLDNAQREILRAQDVLKAIEAQRDEAETVAAKARSKARQLNEERMIQLARDEGRRLGFEEGVRRGRKMGYREGLDEGRSEMRDAAATALDRLFDDGDEVEEQGDTLENVTPVPPPPEPRTTPEVHRVQTPVDSLREAQHNNSRSRRDSMDTVGRADTTRRVRDPVVLPVIVPGPGSTASVPTPPTQASRSQQPQPWLAPEPEPTYTRPASVQNTVPGVHHPEIHVPPDGYIPTADADSNISLPPPHELRRDIPSPEPSQPTAVPPSDGVRSRDYAYAPYPPPRRSSPDDSLASTKQSAASTISQLDLVSLPNARRRDRSQGLSVIHEDVSMRSGQMGEASRTVPSSSQADHRSYHRSERDSQSTETPSRRRDRKSKQRLADELRYSDPSEVEEWRRYGAELTRSQASSGGPPRQRPAHVTTPTPLSPPHMAQPMVSSEHRRRDSMSQRQGRPESRPGQREDNRRPVSSDSSVPEINVEPPVTIFSPPQS
ncbi:hypothetical protein F5I97DRAFT_1858886 [Phlebopus sp. FC_14]|nr:hypothetical protein F5I97DRAFT_1858886 [Phlebopus sp. FC_14]